MSLTMICSAFRKGASNTENALATADLITTLIRSGLEVELCIGTYEGQREISVDVRGIETEEELRYYAKMVLVRFKQEAVYLSIDGRASLVHAAGSTPLGLEVKGNIRALQELTGSCDGTEYLNRLVRGILPSLQSTLALRNAA